MDSFREIIAARFPGARPKPDYLGALQHALAPLGFVPANTIACVGVCRDELCRGFVESVESRWGSAFNFSSLAGMLFLGTTGFGAAHAHAPIDGGRERYLYLAGPHVGVGAGGELGRCRRLGREGFSGACGALIALRDELVSGRVDTRRRGTDVEQSLLKERLLERMTWGQTPDLIALTRIALGAIEDTLARMIELTVDTTTADYAVATQIQIHAPDGTQVIWPSTTYAVVDGARTELDVG